MDKVKSSREADICHVADAPAAHQRRRSDDDDEDAGGFRFSRPSNEGIAASSSSNRYRATAAAFTPDTAAAYPTEETPTYPGDDGAVTTAVLIAAESYAPSSRIPQTKRDHGGSGGDAGKRYTAPYPSSSEDKAAADPFIAELDSESHTYPSEAAHPSSGRADNAPRRLPGQPEDRVRGYSVMQGSSLTSSQMQGGAEAPQPQPQPQQSASDKQRGAATGKAAPQRCRKHHAASDTPDRDGGALVPADASTPMSLTRYSNEEAMKELVSHVERDSYGFDLRDALQEIDFPAVLEEYRRNSSVESSQLQDCRHLFRVVAKNKDAMSAEDVYDLLVLFTPCGASYREGVDFLWENCEGKSSLTFEHFLLYGARLRARLRGYELFSHLSDHDKLIVTYHRVLPKEPLVSANESRVRLLQLADAQLEGTLAPDTRPLRLYEEFFLVEYQEMLYEAALIPASEVPQREPSTDLAHEQQRHAMPRLSVPVLQHENTDWRADGYGEGDRASQVSPVHRDANNQQARPLPPLQSQGKSGRRRVSPSKRGAATARGASGSYDLYQTGGGGGARSARNGGGKGGQAVTLQGRPRADMRKKLGRFVEEEYWERRTLDDHLITQLQGMYGNEQ